VTAYLIPISGLAARNKRVKLAVTVIQRSVVKPLDDGTDVPA
jgi:hypothetical protein